MKRFLPVVCRAAAVGMLVLTGCGRTTSPFSSAAAVDAGGSTPAQLAFEAVNLDMQAADSLRHGPCVPIGFPLAIPGGCEYDAASGSFVCSSDIGFDGLARTRSYQFLDASGTAQSAYDSLTTASIQFASRISGTFTRHGLVSAVDERRDLVESGLEGSEATRIWNGSGTASHRDSATTADGQAWNVTRASTTTIADVVVPAPFTRHSWPLSGTIATHVLSSDGTDITSVITFNGTQFVPMTVGGVTTTINLGRWPLGGPGDHDGRPPRDGNHDGPHGPIAGGDPRGPGRGHH